MPMMWVEEAWWDLNFIYCADAIFSSYNNKLWAHICAKHRSLMWQTNNKAVVNIATKWTSLSAAAYILKSLRTTTFITILDVWRRIAVFALDITNDWRLPDRRQRSVLRAMAIGSELEERKDQKWGLGGGRAKGPNIALTKSWSIP